MIFARDWFVVPALRKEEDESDEFWGIYIIYDIHITYATVIESPREFGSVWILCLLVELVCLCI